MKATRVIFGVLYFGVLAALFCSAAAGAAAALTLALPGING